MSTRRRKGTTATSDQFRVLIVGAGVAGLTLANALEQAGVDYVLLERRSEVAPQIGASIGIFPNGARILDQLGAWKEINRVSEPLQLFHVRDRNGRRMMPPDESNRLISARTGYTVSWGERQHLLRILYQNLKDPAKVLTSKGVVDIEHSSDGATVVCENGSRFHGDLLIGTDGVFSKTRSKIWELAQQGFPNLVAEDKRALIAEYSCLFGIAKGVTLGGLDPGDVDTSYNPKRCVLTITVEGDKVYWFAQERLSKTRHLGDIPRYTAKDAEEFMARNRDIVIRPEPDGLRIGDLWERTVSFRLVAVEEGKFKLWHWGRIACAGDSIHKSTPNLGLGGNIGIESAAVLANGIKRLADNHVATGRKPSQGEIERMLTEYQKERQVRAAAAVDASGALARAQNIHGPIANFFVHFVMPRMTEMLPSLMENLLIGAAKLEFLPLPMASLTGTQPFNPTQGEGFRESKLKRMAFAFPLLGLAVAALFTMNATPSLDWAQEYRNNGTVVLAAGTVPIRQSLYHIPQLDGLISLVNVYFFPSIYGTDPASRRQLISFLTDGTVLLTIWILESVRRANALTILQWPLTLFALPAQFLSIAVFGPLYGYIHYVLSPIESFSALDQRLTHRRWTYASLPAVLLTYLVPFYFACGVFSSSPFSSPPPSSPATSSSLHQDDSPATAAAAAAAAAAAEAAVSRLQLQQTVLFLWQLYPVYCSVALRLLARLLCPRDPADTDKLLSRPPDLPVVRRYVGLASALAAAAWLWACRFAVDAGPGADAGMYHAEGGLRAWRWLVRATEGARAVFVPRGLPSRAGSLARFAAELLRWDYLFSLGGQLLWLAYLFGDLARAGMLREGWARVVAVGVVCVLVVGPGATMGLGWLFREHILATRRHKNALTPESLGRLHGVVG